MLALTIGALALLLLVVVFVWLSRDVLTRGLVKDRLVFTLRGGESFDGLLVGSDAKTFRVANAFALDGKTRMRVDGELFLPRAEVLYLQKTGGAA